ncbi:hypothetical protein N4T20_02245 [Flavobacterium sp. TR2]|nr:hypothetical protein [Flavobacterium sp. TR2]UWY28755.1 hypothetical protein N4T20_02245 [Flavobacterium sp. TR2]
MKNPFKKTRLHKVNAELNGMQTVTTVTFFGIPIYRSTKNKAVTVSWF